MDVGHRMCIWRVVLDRSASLVGRDICRRLWSSWCRRTLGRVLVRLRERCGIGIDWIGVEGRAVSFVSYIIVGEA